MAELVLFGIYFSINLMWSLVLGTAGLYSFATPAFVGAAAYTCAWLSLNHGLPWWLYAPIGLAVGAVCGFLVALPAVRLRGVYFALLTIGLVEACNQYVTADTENLGGAQGLVGSDSIIPPSKQGLIDGYYYAYVAIGVIVGRGAARLLVGLLRPARPAAAHGARIGDRGGGARHRHPARAPGGVRDHRGRARSGGRIQGVLRRGREQERVRLLDAAAAVRDDRRRRHQLGQGHPDRHRAAAVHRTALRQLGRAAPGPARRDHAHDHADQHRRACRHSPIR